MAEKTRRSLAARLLLGAIRIVVGVAVFFYSVLDELLFPVFRPLMRWVGKLELLQRLGRLIGRSPPYAVLAMLATPFILIEPAKLFAVYLLATGKFVSGGLTMLVAQVLSLTICERIFHVGREPLMRIGWFAVTIRFVVGIRDAIFGWVKSTGVWKAAARQVQRVKAWFRWLFRRALRAEAKTPHDGAGSAQSGDS